MPVPQDHSRATVTKRLTKESGKIDWSKSAEELERQVRALYPWPGTWCALGEKKITLLKTSAADFDEEKTIGTLALIRDASFIQAKLSDMWRRNFFRLLFHVFLISLVSLVIIRWNILSPIDEMTNWMKHIRAGTAGTVR